MQVYRDLRIVTARPSAKDEAVVPHRLYGHVDAAERYSVGQWLRAVMAELAASNSIAIVGGTGLYFDALERGLARVPNIPEEVRQRWRDASLSELRRELARRDPNANMRLDPTDRQRIQRAIEVHDATGRTLADWWVETEYADPLGSCDVTRVVLEPDRSTLRKRIAERFEQMMMEGAVEEVASLFARNLDPTLPAMRAIGVREIGSMLAGERSRDEAIERSVIASCQYAKRQSTWFRNRFGPAWRRVGSVDDARAALGLA